MSQLWPLHGVHDYRSRTVHSLFGICRLRVPRFRSCTCGKPAKANTGNIETLLKGRATPELERVQAKLGSRLSFREAARVLDLFVPAARPHNHRTVVNRLAKVAVQIEKWDAASPYRMSRVRGSSISAFIDGAYIRAVPGYQGRHFEIAMGRVVSPGRPPRQFAAAACSHRQARCGSCRDAGARIAAWPRRHCFQRRRRRAAKHRAQCRKAARDAYS